MKATSQVNPASFRDPSGFLFSHEGEIYRQVNLVYRNHYDQFLQSGLYQDLVTANLLIGHDEVEMGLARSDAAYRILKPERVPFISYPYEWCFSELKNAALVTLRIQKLALKRGMFLKDSSAYNIQFVNGRPVLIDTLSFETYREGEPWIAYRQFCQHFLAPLALMSQTDCRLNQLSRIHLDGIPLDLASSLLPFRSRLRFSLLMHIYLHAKSQRRYEGKAVARTAKITRFQLEALMDNLESAVQKLTWRPKGTQWGDYYSITNYTDSAFSEKKRIVSQFLDRVPKGIVWDLGANVGIFSRLATARGLPVVALDSDPVAVEKNYLVCLREKSDLLLPLYMDLTNPSGPVGFESCERMSLTERGPAMTLMALALIHHLAISNNVPLERIARYFHKLTTWMIIEFVPKQDSQVQKLLSTREDVFPNYHEDGFLDEFRKYFQVHEAARIEGTERTLYLMQKIEM